MMSQEINSPFRYAGGKFYARDLILEHFPEHSSYIAVHPDLGIVVRDERGIVGEVKKNFPKDDVQRSEKIFEQLKKYDQNLLGWPTATESLPGHQIVLLVHQTTAKSAEDYSVSETSKGNLAFSRPFSIIRFNRSDQRQPYFFFQHAQSPLPYILHLVWEHVITPLACQDPKFERLR